MKTFNLVFTTLLLSSLLLSSLFITSCSDTTEQVQKPVLPPQPPIGIPTSSFTDQQRVCTLIEATINMLTTDNKTLDEYYDEDLWELLEIENPTSGELEEIEDLALAGIGNMFTSDGSFQSAFNAVVGLELTQEEFEDYAENCEVEQINGNSFSRWCLFCNVTACGRNVALNVIGEALSNVVLYAGSSLGMWVHCNH